MSSVPNSASPRSPKTHARGGHARMDSLVVEKPLFPDEEQIKAAVSNACGPTSLSPKTLISPLSPPVSWSDPLWYKSALIYQIHVKAFCDSNGDGIGDFKGLTSKLDYLADLGVTCLWLLPFYVSPGRDDGYDIADYRSVNPIYGTLDDFKEFLEQAHKRHMRVITELVINHSSDQHPWFQRARRSPPGSPERDYYIWSDTDTKFDGTRIIFRDFERSNWEWDEVANAYFFHRFYRTQPDLNFDNPRVFQEVADVMSFWLDLGVDGLRLDAIPYLAKREGTNNENLPETHAIIKRLRKVMDDSYPGRMLLAEANQWPEDTYHYFGDGDECHMAFHFPVMPRIYMALAQEDRHPITDILRQTPDIPEDCQWGIFLRNHDELTLEMVTDDERDYMWSYYSADPQARINLGIRRRLAPLMGNDRRKIELMNSLLFSMPGTPIIYYGDEIGSGDNIFLGDRNGVRTPMQWSPDRNGGFSRAEPSQLYLPCITDSVFGYQVVNVEAQTKNAASLLNWMKRMIEIRKAHSCFGKGTVEFLYPGNRKVLAFLRKDEVYRDYVLCVCNLSRAAQAVELDLSAYRGFVPVELLGRSVFPPIGDLPYLLTIPAYGFYWFIITDQASCPKWHDDLPAILPDFSTLVLTEPDWASLTDTKLGKDLQRTAVSAYLKQQPWFLSMLESKSAESKKVSAEILYAVPMPRMENEILVAIFQVAPLARLVYLPVALNFDRKAATIGWHMLPFTIAKARRVNHVGALVDAVADNRYSFTLLRNMMDHVEVKLPSKEGVSLRFWCSDSCVSTLQSISEDSNVRRFIARSEHSSVIIDDKVVLKTFRHAFHNVHPVIEMNRFLTEVAHFSKIARLVGLVELVDSSGIRTPLAICQEFVGNQGSAYDVFKDYLVRFIETCKAAPNEDMAAWDATNIHGANLTSIHAMGKCVGEFHAALNRMSGDPAFDPETFGEQYIESIFSRLSVRLNDAFEALTIVYNALPDADPLYSFVSQLLDQRKTLETLLLTVSRLSLLQSPSVHATRIHGHLELVHILLAFTDWVILGLDGEPSHSLSERRAKHHPVKDLATVGRSLSRIAGVAFMESLEVMNPRAGMILSQLSAWVDAAEAAFLQGYFATSSYDKSTNFHLWLSVFKWNRLFAEIVRDATERPQDLTISVPDALRLLQSHMDLVKALD